MGGSITQEALENILKECGFEPYAVIREDLTDAYLNKWGHEGMERFIKRGKIIAFKPEIYS